MSIRKLKKELKKHSEIVTITFQGGFCYSIFVNGTSYCFYPHDNEVEVMYKGHILYEDYITKRKIKDVLKSLKRK